MMSGDEALELLRELVALARRAEARELARSRRAASSASTRSRRARAQAPVVHYSEAAQALAQAGLRRRGVLPG